MSTQSLTSRSKSPAGGTAVTPPPVSGRRRDRGALWRTPLGVSAAALLLGVLVLAVVAPIVWGDRASAIDTDALAQGSSAAHWMGTDDLGRDILARILVATRLSVILAVLATAIGVGVGIVLGTLPWLLGRRLGRFATAVVNVAVAFPALLLALFFAVIFGVEMKGAVLAIGLATVPWFARVTQTLVAGVQHRDFVAAARIAGLSKPRILLRHILPNIGEPLVVNATIGAGGALLAFAGLSFLGLGVQAPRYDWGLLLNEGLDGIYVRPAGAIAPGVAIVVAGLAFNLFGEAIATSLGLRTARITKTATPQTAPAEDTSEQADDDVLVVRNLTVTVPGPVGAPVRPVRGVDFSIARAESVGVVGESGSGKSLTALAVAQLLEPPIRVTAERLEFLGTDLRTANGSRRRLLGTSLGLVFQDPTTSLNPTMRIGPQLAEVVRRHEGLGRRRALERAVDRLRAVRVPAAHRRAGQYPHEFSGGMRQRAMVAMAIMGEPALIVADEPTTALDVTVQRQVLRLLLRIRAERASAILLISHDVTVVSQVCDRVLVMYAGRIVEDAPAGKLHSGARHPYTRALLAAVPDMTADRDQPLAVIPGRPVDPAQQPAGCAFAARCPRAGAECLDEDPALLDDGTGHRVACWHPHGVSDG